MKEDFKLDAGKTQTFTVSCEEVDGLAISGGYSIDGDVTLVGSRPAKNGWEVTLTSHTKARKTVSVSANCLLAFSGKVQTTLIEQIVEGRRFADIKLGCQIAGMVVGGGFDLSKSPDLVVTGSRLVGKEWVISVVNQGRNTQTLDAYAQCLTGSKLPSLTIRNDAVKISAGENQIITLNCGATPISGGFQAPVGLIFSAIQPTANGWTFEVENETQRQLIFKPQAVCVGPSLQRDQQVR